VATVRALKFHGGVRKEDLNQENLSALERGLANLERHVHNIREHYRLPCVVSINHFTFDSQAEIVLLRQKCEMLGVEVVVARHWAEGSAGAEKLARVIARQVDDHPGQHTFVYAADASLWDKIDTIARHIYGAAGIRAEAKVRQQLAEWSAAHPDYPVCIAKTQMSFSTDPGALGAPAGHHLHIREVRLCNGAGFVVAIAGDIMTMPGLPKNPAAEAIDIDEHGQIVGLF
jgi:formate--tetrahydrofolate ligase